MIRLIHGEAIEEMDKLIAEGIKVDAIITDPPYETTKLSWDKIIPFEPMWERLKLLRNDNTPIVLFGNEPFSSYLRISNIKEYKYDIYWEKERLTNIMQVKKRVGKTVENMMLFYPKQCLYIPQKIAHTGKLRTNKVKDGSLGVLVDSKGKVPTSYQDDRTRYPTDIWKYNRDILTSNIHPTQKPIALMENLVRTYTNEGDTVLDFTCGSGSTGVACSNLNRSFIGIDNGVCDKEKSEFFGWKWVDVAKYRIEHEGR